MSISPPVKPALYVDTSALMSALLEGDSFLLHHLQDSPVRVTSALTIAEAPRSLLRALKNGRITAAQQRSLLQRSREFLVHCTIVELDSAILERAGQPFAAEFMGTLDAIHLASAMLYDSDVGPVSAIATRDLRLRDNAVAHGFGLIPASL